MDARVFDPKSFDQKLNVPGKARGIYSNSIGRTMLGATSKRDYNPDASRDWQKG